ncbi:hypothetical protein AWC16_22135 [Mycolicibacter longobardus]|uniref:Uncharacterized protein n=2 Tax=Mycolicibacter longobardus TaxID=1108812 RepID=A0A1X1Y7E6_9MYCO|nr:hypothetical protein AWC16_22135 [Mycolicibacter longobardus]
MGPRGFVVKAGALAAGTIFAGASLLGGTAVAPTTGTSLTASVQHDIVLSADEAFPTFTESLQTLLNAIELGTVGQLLAVFGEDISTSSTLSALLLALNPEGTSLDDITLGLLSTDFSELLSSVEIGGVSLGAIPINELIGDFLGSQGADTSLGTVLTALGLGDYAGLLNIPFTDFSPNTTVAELLELLLGIDSTTTLNDLLVDNELDEATIGGLLGIDSSLPWNQIISGLVVGGTLTEPEGTGVLGDETLGSLLTLLLGTGAEDVTDATTLTDFLDALGIFGMLGVS